MDRKKSAPQTAVKRSRQPVTGIRLPDDLVLEAKHRALDERRTLREVIELALKAYLKK